MRTPQDRWKCAICGAEGWWIPSMHSGAPPINDHDTPNGDRCVINPPSSPRYILWDPKDGEIPRNADGAINTNGLIGDLGHDNVYLRVWAVWPDARRPSDLKEVGERICGVVFRLSGERGVYDVVRSR